MKTWIEELREFLGEDEFISLCGDGNLKDIKFSLPTPSKEEIEDWFKIQRVEEKSSLPLKLKNILTNLIKAPRNGTTQVRIKNDVLKQLDFISESYFPFVPKNILIEAIIINLYNNIKL